MVLQTVGKKSDGLNYSVGNLNISLTDRTLTAPPGPLDLLTQLKTFASVSIARNFSVAVLASEFKIP